MNAVGVAQGRCRGHMGYFKMSLVEVMPQMTAPPVASRTKRHPVGTNTNSHVMMMSGGGGGGVGGSSNSNSNGNSGQSSVEELLIRIGLKEYTSVFILNGYEDLELFRELEPADLDYLGILNVDHRGKILSAVQLLHDMDCKFWTPF